ncbi:MAG: porin [Kangiellaceae bacterium]|nr:porin [Kangiellaceae bacterium]
MKKIFLSFVLSAICFSPQLIATEINFSGFATIAGGLTTDDNETLQGYDSDLSVSNNSLIALQASTDLGEGWGITTQLISKGSEDWNLATEWAFVSYDTSNDWRFLFGRQRAPFYVYSDYLDVSYAYHWINPPGGVYSLPFDTVDGIGVIKNSTLGSFDSTIHFTTGRNQGDFEVQGLPSEADFGDFYSFAWTLNKDWFTVRLSYASSTFSVFADALTPLTDGWRAANFPQVADSLEVVDDSGDFKGIGIIIDYNNFLFVTEFTQVDPGDSFFPPNDSYYLSFGYRTNNGMFHLTTGVDDNEPNFAMLNGIPSGVDPGLDFLIASTQGLLQSNLEDTSFYTLGYKWDLDAPISLKFEYTTFEDDVFSTNEASLLQFAIVTVF